MPKKIEKFDPASSHKRRRFSDGHIAQTLTIICSPSLLTLPMKVPLHRVSEKKIATFIFRIAVAFRARCCFVSVTVIFFSSVFIRVFFIEQDVRHRPYAISLRSDAFECTVFNNRRERSSPVSRLASGSSHENVPPSPSHHI